MRKQKHPAPVLWARSQDLPSSQKLVLLCLALRCNIDWQCWPSIAQLTKDSGLKDRAIRAAIHGLSMLNLIATQHRYKQSMIYVLSPALDAGQKELQLLSALGAGQNSPYSRGYNKGWADHTRLLKGLGLDKLMH